MNNRKYNNFEMFQAGSQDFYSRPGSDERLGFIDFCAVQYEFFSAQAAIGLILRRQPASAS